MQRLGRGVLEAHRSWDARDHCLAGGGRWGQRQKPRSEPSPQPSHVRDCRARAHQERRGCVQPVPAPQEASPPATLPASRETEGQREPPALAAHSRRPATGPALAPLSATPLGASARCLRRAEGTAPWDTWEKQRPTSPRACCNRRAPCHPSGLVHPFLRGLHPRHLADDEGRLREGRGSPESTAPDGGAQVRARPTHNGCPRGVRAGAVDAAAMPRVA